MQMFAGNMQTKMQRNC